MESTSPLSTESFSGSSLVCYNPSSYAPPAINSSTTSFDAADDASFIELDPNLPASRRFYRVGKDFSFDFRAHESPEVNLADDADELITDDLPLPISTAVDHNHGDEAAVIATPPKEVNSSNRVACSSFRRFKTVTKRIFHKYFEFIAPLWEKLQRRRRFASTSRVTSMSTQPDQCLTPPTASSSSPKANSTASINKYQHFNNGDSECSISEAVLHCKRTNGMQCHLP